MTQFKHLEYFARQFKNFEYIQDTIKILRTFSMTEFLKLRILFTTHFKHLRYLSRHNLKS